MFKRKGSIKRKIMLGTIIPIVVLSQLFSLGFYFQATSIVTDHVNPQSEIALKSNLLHLSNELDAERINEAKTNQRVQEELLAYITTFNKNSNTESIYIKSKVDGKDVFLAMADSTEYLTPYPFTSEQNEALTTDQPLISEIYEDDYGVHKSIFVHVEGTDSIIGIDQDAKFITDLERSILLICIVLSLGSLVVGSVVSYVVSMKITKPIQQLVEFAEIIAQGDLTKEVSVVSRDEIGLLAFSFQNMQQELKTTIEHVNVATDNLVTSSEDLTYSAEQMT